MSSTRWTKARLLRHLQLFFPAERGNRVDVAAAAAAMGVSPRTVRRWLQGSPRQKARIPQRRLAQLLAFTTPRPERIEQELQQARYAYEAVQQIRVPRQAGVLDSWRRQQWLDDHLVVVIEVRWHGQRLRQLLAGRATAAKMAEFAKRGRILDQATVPTRFDATLLIQHWLDQLAPWRIRASERMVPSSFTQVWTADAPTTFLGRTAWELQRDLPRFAPDGDEASRRETRATPALTDVGRRARS